VLLQSVPGRTKWFFYASWTIIKYIYVCHLHKRCGAVLVRIVLRVGVTGVCEVVPAFYDSDLRTGGCISVFLCAAHDENLKVIILVPETTHLPCAGSS